MRLVGPRPAAADQPASKVADKPADKDEKSNGSDAVGSTSE